MLQYSFMVRYSLGKLLFLAIVLLGTSGLAACDFRAFFHLSDGSGTAENRPPGAAADFGVTQWQQVDSAIELGTLQLAAGTTRATATVVRFDPAAYKVSIMYDVGNAGTVQEWFQTLNPLVVVNGGYFDEQRRATALVIFDGVKRGESYQGFGGMVLTNAAGEFELRSLQQQPYDPDELLRQAMQSAPMLIQPGGELSQLEDDGDRSRRTVIARDTYGRILLIVCEAPVLTLSQLAFALQSSDLNLDAALNLDGGRSTGLYLQTDVATVTINSLDRIPLVLIVEQQAQR